MHKIWIFIWRLNPPHNWHLNTIKKSLKFNDLTIVILWSANVTDEKNPYDILTRINFIEEHFNNEKLIVETIDDMESDEEWVKEIKNILDIYKNEDSEICFYTWDFENDYAIKAIKEYENKLDNKNFKYHEFSRNELKVEHNSESFCISSTLLRKAIEENDIDFIKKLTHPNIYKKLWLKV